PQKRSAICQGARILPFTTGKVVNNDYNWLTTYFEVNFRPWHKKGAPELYPVELREEIDKMNRSGKPSAAG
ncbi:hypothetical protein DW642_12205, partial [Blautia sp. AM23-13AC]